MTPTGSGSDLSSEPHGTNKGRPPDPRAGLRWELPGGKLLLDRPRIMGVLNLTPDSFSDGGDLASEDEAMGRAEEMVAAGADLLDVGGESTRPGAAEVPVAEEIRRVVPFIRRASRLSVPISVDTRKAEVARAAVEAGAAVVNDVSGLRHDPAMARTVGELGAGVVIMHMRGTPGTMGGRTEYGDLVSEVRDELEERTRAAREAGIAPSKIVVDPGIGFAKTAGQSLVLIRDLDRLLGLGYPVLVGPSRKSFLGAVLGTPPRDRLEGTVVACVAAYARGARVFRVHDVDAVARALSVARAIEEGGPPGGEEDRVPGLRGEATTGGQARGIGP